VLGNASLEFEPRPISEQYRSVPYRPDTVADGWSTERFTVRAASVRGLLHRHNGAPRQDDFAVAYSRSPERLIIAVADGVSSAPQSHLGATVAVRFALQQMATRVEGGVASVDWLELMRHCAWQLVEQAHALFPDAGVGTPSPARAESLMATTLVCALLDFPEDAPGATVQIAGVGDSGAWILDRGTFDRVFGGKSDGDSSITSSAVSGLPQVPTEMTPTVVTLPPGSTLLLGTDGFGDPLGNGGGIVGQAFAGGLASPPAMLEFAHLLDFSRETFDDDRTLVGVWVSEPGPDGGNESEAPA